MILEKLASYIKIIWKKVGALDGDSAGTLAYNKGWKIVDDSYAFSNAIYMADSYLIWVSKYQQCYILSYYTVIILDFYGYLFCMLFRYSV